MPPSPSPAQSSVAGATYALDTTSTSTFNTSFLSALGALVNQYFTQYYAVSTSSLSSFINTTFPYLLYNNPSNPSGASQAAVQAEMQTFLAAQWPLQTFLTGPNTSLYPSTNSLQNMYAQYKKNGGSPQGAVAITSPSIPTPPSGYQSSTGYPNISAVAAIPSATQQSLGLQIFARWSKNTNPFTPTTLASSNSTFCFPFSPVSPSGNTGACYPLYIPVFSS